MSTMKNRHAGHAKRMIKILEGSDHIIERCPAMFINDLLRKHRYKDLLNNRRYDSQAFISADKSFKQYCENICRPFIGIADGEYVEACPCYIFGCEEAAKRTWIALEEKGFI